MTPDASDVGVVVVTYNALPDIERCLESLRGYDVVVVDHGSTDGTVELVRERFPGLRLVVAPNRGLAAGWNRGLLELPNRRYYLILNADTWVDEDTVERLTEFADAHPEAAVVGPRISNPDGTLQRSIRRFPTPWDLVTEYLFLRRATGGRIVFFGSSAGAGLDHNRIQEADWVEGAAMLIRGEAIDDAGNADETFFLFSEEVDWCHRFRLAGWKTMFYPGAHVTHVGEASHGGRMVQEIARSNLLYMAKYRGNRAAEISRHVMAAGVAIRALLYRGPKKRANWLAFRWLRSGSASELVTDARDSARSRSSQVVSE